MAFNIILTEKGKRSFMGFLLITGLLFIIQVIPSSLKGRAYSFRSLEFVYKLEIVDLPEGKHRVEIWIPIPQSNFYQEIADIKIESEFEYSFHSEPEYGNQMAYIKATAESRRPIAVTLRFKVKRRAFSIRTDKEGDRSLSETRNLQRFLRPDSLVPIDGQIAQEANRVIEVDMSPLQKARALYDYVVRTVAYDKSGSGWGRGDAIYACDVKRGNCTDFHSLFIGMARSCGIPARFVIGFPVPAEKLEGIITGYQCWAEFYLKEKGWIPIDASEAFKHPEQQEFLFGGLDANRVEFTIGRDIQLLPSVTSKRLNYFIYPFVRVDGIEYHNAKTEFYYKNIETFYTN